MFAISGNDWYVETVDSLSSSSICPVVSCIQIVKQAAEQRSLTCLTINATNKLFIWHDRQLIKRVIWIWYEAYHLVHNCGLRTCAKIWIWWRCFSKIKLGRIVSSCFAWVDVTFPVPCFVFVCFFLQAEAVVMSEPLTIRGGKKNKTT